MAETTDLEILNRALEPSLSLDDSLDFYDRPLATLIFSTSTLHSNLHLLLRILHIGCFFFYIYTQKIKIKIKIGGKIRDISRAFSF